MVRFLHVADFHLGSHLSTRPPDAAGDDAFADAPYVAVRRLMDVAIEEAVDFVVVAGDLYDDDARSVRANRFLVEQFGRLDDAGIPVYVLYGNHDPVGSATRYVELPENVHEFDHEDAEAVSHPDETAPIARIWGQSYRDRHESRTMHRSFAPADDGVPTVGVLHTGLDPDGGRYVPVSAATLAGTEGIDYWALGHVHDARVLGDETPLVYPGVPQGRQITEAGPGGGFLVELDADGTAELAFVPTSPVVWRTVTVDVGDGAIETIPDLERALVAAADDLLAGDDGAAPPPSFDHPAVGVREPAADDVAALVLRWRLVGNGPIHDPLTADEASLDAITETLRDRLATRSPTLWTETVRDETGPPVPDVADLRERDPVVDEFLTMLAETDRERLRERVRDTDVVGLAWEPVDDHEDVDVDELPLTDERLDALIDRAEKRVLDELALRGVE